jgi:hypothetical protein
MTQNEWAPYSSADADTWSLDPDAVAPHPDELFRALNDRTRRQLLHLLTHQSTATVDTLAEMVLSLRHSGSQSAGPEEHKQLTTALEHVHLPLLVDIGLIEHDRTTGTVEMTTIATPVEELIDFASQYELAHADHCQ